MAATAASTITFKSAGSLFQNVLLISKSGSEGLDLKGTNYIIIMEPQWNENSIEQIIGRGVRYKSHEGLPKSKQLVTVYKLYAIKPQEYKELDSKLQQQLQIEKDRVENTITHEKKVYNILIIKNFKTIKISSFSE